MGCNDSQETDNNQQMLWIAGMICAGKTFLGDYLETRGYHHIEGDQGNQTKDPAIAEMWANLMKANMQSQRKESVDP